MSDPKTICEDCDPSPTSSQAEPQTQPASVTTMAHEPTKEDKPNNISPKEFKFPVPNEPPNKASHKTEFTFSGPPTPDQEGKQLVGNDKDKKDKDQEESGLRSPEPKARSQPSPQQQQQGEEEKQGNSETFAAPDLRGIKPSVIIEFCDRCRWAPRATWIQTELFLTFPNPLIRSITLLPLNAPETGGRFRVWVNVGSNKGDELVWDRKTEGGFPELKILKQRIRNLVQPDLNLGHSDVNGKQNNTTDKPQETGLAN